MKKTLFWTLQSIGMLTLGALLARAAPAPYPMLTIDENIQYDASTTADVRYMLNVNARMNLSATGVTLADE